MSTDFDFLAHLNAYQSAQEAKAAAPAAGENRYLQMPTGTGFKTLRLLGPLAGAPPFVDLHLHYLESGPLGCPNDYSGRFSAGPCPLCAYASDLYKQRAAAKRRGDTAEEKRLTDLVGKFKSVDRYVWNVWDRDEGAVKLLSCGKKVHEKIVTSILGDPRIGETGLGDVTNVVHGRDFKLVKDISTGYPNYDKSKFVAPSVLAESEARVAEILAARHDLVAEKTTATLAELGEALDRLTGAGGSAPSQSTALDDDAFFATLRGTL